jgi:hypothetical protein
VTGYLRVRHRMLQTRVVRFEHPESGRRVTVVATVHLGPAAYYEQLRIMINEMESAGAVVCYESAGSATKQECGAASDEERAAAQGDERSELDKAAARYFGWVDQWTALGSSPSWRNADMTRLEFVRRAGPQNLLSLQRDYSLDLPGWTQGQQEAFAGGGSAILLRLAQFAWSDLLRRLLGRLAGDAPRRVADVDVEDRNRHVLASLPTDSDAVLPWGAAHAPGLAAGLQKAGYRQRNTTWVTVGRLPAIWPSVKALWSGARALRAALHAQGDNTSAPTRPESAA